MTRVPGHARRNWAGTGSWSVAGTQAPVKHRVGGWLVVLTLLPVLPLLADNVAPKPRDLGAVGWTRGFVLDAETGKRIEGAQVELVLPADAQPVSNSKATTSKEGWYQLNAPLGTRKSSFNWNPLKDSLFSLAFGSRKVDAHVQAGQMVVRVSREGYRTFTGPVYVVHATAKPFMAHLQCVRLAPQGAAYRSFADTVFSLGALAGVELSLENPQPNEFTTCRMVASDLALMSGEQPVASCYWSGLKSAVLLGRVGNSEPSTFEAKWRFARPGLLRLDIQLWGSLHSAPRTILTQRYLAVGLTPGENPTAVADLHRLNVLAASRPEDDLERRSLVCRLSNALRDPAQAAAEDKAWAGFVEAMEKRQYAAAVEVTAGLFRNEVKRYSAEIEGRAAAGLPSARPGPGFAAVGAAMSAAAVVADPSDVAARQRFFWSSQKYLAAARANEPELREVLRTPAMVAVLSDPQLPPLPKLADPRARLKAAELAITEGRTEGVATELQALRQDAKVGLTAGVALAEWLYRKGDTAAAKAVYGDIIIPANYRGIQDWRAYLNTIRIALSEGDWARAEALIDVALAYSKGQSSTLAENHGSGFAPGVGFYTLRSGTTYTGTVGFTHPAAYALHVLRTYYPFLTKPETDWQGAALAALALIDLGAAQQALPLLARAVEARPEEECALFGLAWALQAAGDRSGAQKAAGRLLALNPRHPQGRALQAMLERGGVDKPRDGAAKGTVFGLAGPS